MLASKKGSNSKGKKKACSPAADDECRYCHETGHWINKCPKREEDEKKKKSGGGSGSANLAVTDLRE
ncbi:hypothetical protein H0H81_012017, partial [Sphagnurus paluster]